VKTAFVVEKKGACHVQIDISSILCFLLFKNWFVEIVTRKTTTNWYSIQFFK